MVVILVGCDGTGKSTCFNLLRQNISGNFIKESYTDDGDAKLIRVLFTASKTNDNDLTIYDRATIIDDIVYQKVIVDQTSVVLSLGVEQLQKTLSRCLVLYFDLDDSILSDRLSNRGDEYITIDQIADIKRNYWNVFDFLEITPLVIDTTGKNEQQVYEEARRIIENEKSKNS